MTKLICLLKGHDWTGYREEMGTEVIESSFGRFPTNRKWYVVYMRCNRCKKESCRFERFP